MENGTDAHDVLFLIFMIISYNVAVDNKTSMNFISRSFLIWNLEYFHFWNTLMSVNFSYCVLVKR